MSTRFFTLQAPKLQNGVSLTLGASGYLPLNIQGAQGIAPLQG
jgi:hypothetical protein